MLKEEREKIEEKLRIAVRKGILSAAADPTTLKEVLEEYSPATFRLK